jgi:hypothetical protein
VELIHHRQYHTRQEARAEIFPYIEVFSTGNDVTPLSAICHQSSLRKWPTLLNEVSTDTGKVDHPS